MTASSGLTRAVASALERVATSRRLDRADGVALIDAAAHELPAILDTAAALRDRGKGRTVTYSRKVFLPLTNLCRDDCGYCTFKRDPGQPGARTMELDEVLAVCDAGARLGCKEALLSATSPKPGSRSIGTGFDTAATARPWTTSSRHLAPSRRRRDSCPMPTRGS